MYCRVLVESDYSAPDGSTKYKFVLRSVSLSYGVWNCTTENEFVPQTTSTYDGI